MNNMTKILTGGAVALVAVLAFVFGQNITFKQGEIAAATAKAGSVQEIQKNQAQGAVTNAPGAPFLPPVPSPPPNNGSVKLGCMMHTACNYDPTAKVEATCYFAYFAYGDGGKLIPNLLGDKDSQANKDLVAGIYKPTPNSPLGFSPDPMPLPNNSCSGFAGADNCPMYPVSVVTTSLSPTDAAAEIPIATFFGFFDKDWAQALAGKKACKTDIAKLKVDEMKKAIDKRNAEAKAREEAAKKKGNLVPNN